MGSILSWGGKHCIEVKAKNCTLNLNELNGKTGRSTYNKYSEDMIEEVKFGPFNIDGSLTVLGQKTGKRSIFLIRRQNGLVIQ